MPVASDDGRDGRDREIEERLLLRAEGVRRRDLSLRRRRAFAVRSTVMGGIGSGRGAGRRLRQPELRFAHQILLRTAGGVSQRGLGEREHSKERKRGDGVAEDFHGLSWGVDNLLSARRMPLPLELTENGRISAVFAHSERLVAACASSEGAASGRGWDGAFRHERRASSFSGGAWSFLRNEICVRRRSALRGRGGRQWFGGMTRAPMTR